jgi:hypothetical protein
VGSCEQDTEPSGSIKCVEFLDYRSEYELLKGFSEMLMLAIELELDKHTLKHEVQIIFKHSVPPSKKK